VTKREMSGDLYSIYDENILKDIIHIVLSFSQMLKEKYIQKYFGFSKMDKKNVQK